MGVFAVLFVGVVIVFVGVMCDVAVVCCWVVVSGRGGNGDGGRVLTGGAGDVASGSEVGRRQEGGMVVVVVKKAVMCHDWNAFPDLGKAGPRTAGVGYDHIMFHKW